jgi:hypothetical protein
MHITLLQSWGALRPVIASGVYPLWEGGLHLAAFLITPRKLHVLEFLVGLVLLLALMQQLAKVSKPIAFIWDGWNTVMHAIGNFQARVILTLLYAIVALPFGLIVRFFIDPLRIKHPPTAWLPQSQEKMDMPWARRQ